MSICGCVVHVTVCVHSACAMPRTFLVERIVDMTSSVNSTDVTDDVTLDGGLHEEQRCDEMRQKTMTSQRRGVAMDTSVVDYRAGVGALG